MRISLGSASVSVHARRAGSSYVQTVSGVSFCVHAHCGCPVPSSGSQCLTSQKMFTLAEWESLTASLAPDEDNTPGVPGVHAMRARVLYTRLHELHPHLDVCCQVFEVTPAVSMTPVSPGVARDVPDTPGPLESQADTKQSADTAESVTDGWSGDNKLNMEGFMTSGLTGRLREWMEPESKGFPPFVV